MGGGEGDYFFIILHFDLNVQERMSKKNIMTSFRMIPLPLHELVIFCGSLLHPAVQLYYPSTTAPSSFPSLFFFFFPSQGMCQDPGRVFKGKKMPGRMGGVRVTKQNLRIVKIDRGRDLIDVRGAVPGNKGEFVEIRDAVKRPLFGTDKCEGGKESAFPPLPTFSYEEGVDGCGDAGHEVMMPMQEQDPLEIVESDAD
jgi:hypothetical protein